MGAGDQHVKALARCLMGKRLGQMAFSHARLAADQHIAVLADEGAGGQIMHQLPVDGGVKAEVEAGQGLAAVQAAAADAHGQLLLVPAFHFVLHQAGEELEMAPLLASGLIGAHLETIQDAGEAQLLELGDQVLHVHRPPPTRLATNSALPRAKA